MQGFREPTEGRGSEGGAEASIRMAVLTAHSQGLRGRTCACLDSGQRVEHCSAKREPAYPRGQARALMYPDLSDQSVTGLVSKILHMPQNRLYRHYPVILFSRKLSCKALLESRNGARNGEDLTGRSVLVGKERGACVQRQFALEEGRRTERSTWEGTRVPFNLGPDRTNQRQRRVPPPQMGSHATKLESAACLSGFVTASALCNPSTAYPVCLFSGIPEWWDRSFY